jgi:hypothetical protein
LRCTKIIFAKSKKCKLAESSKESCFVDNYDDVDDDDDDDEGEEEEEELI